MKICSFRVFVDTPVTILGLESIVFVIRPIVKKWLSGDRSGCNLSERTMFSTALVNVTFTTGPDPPFRWVFTSSSLVRTNSKNARASSKRRLISFPSLILSPLRGPKISKQCISSGRGLFE